MKREHHDKKISVFGLFHDADTLGRAVEALQTGGFPTTRLRRCAMPVCSA